MAFQINFSVQTIASANEVWQVIEDLPAYGEWNPFVVGCRSSLEEGEPIYLDVVLIAGIVQSQKETIFENRPKEVISYGIGDGLGYGKSKTALLNSYRSHRVESLNGGGCIYHSRFELGGAFSPVVALFMKKRLEKQFKAMTDAVVKRAETLVIT